jgi:hypothetical protein
MDADGGRRLLGYQFILPPLNGPQRRVSDSPALFVEELAGILRFDDFAPTTSAAFPNVFCAQPADRTRCYVGVRHAHISIQFWPPKLTLPGGGGGN